MQVGVPKTLMLLKKI